jgi:site-specific recombinase XerD
MTPLATHVSVFLRERLPLERRASERTCDTYALALRLFFEFAARRLKVRPSALGLEQLDAPLVLDFLTHLETQRANSPATRNVRLAAIRAFMRFIEYREPSALEQIQRIRAIPMKRTDARLVDYLNRDEMQALLDAPSPNSRDGIRDRAMLYVAYSAGLRVSELVGLRLENLSFNPRLSILVLGKGRRERALPLWRETATALRAWLALRPYGSSDGGLSQCTRSRDDPLRVRVHSGQTCSNGGTALPRSLDEERISPLPSTFMRPFNPAIDG